LLNGGGVVGHNLDAVSVEDFLVCEVQLVDFVIPKVWFMLADM